ncbi:protein ROOT PRIMORDIUM DEFECTIVE 1 [Prunus yedoensis var. nudiflora]|uniref:Protein ROOT PRIMORDIUM DEFECTIVE 1 n=1 Tax=Prunus yedoensis var. nudiflora TaxID=2094558 RepID=A0A314ZI72_PRUYE|nr:protein ROOT PRIMORDIUM DEFECTIVE 1 [Prunus yedoensis var. nudiflora]
MFVRRYWSVGSWSKDQKRFMTTSKRVQDRSKLKRIHDLEIVTEKWKIASKVLFLMEILKKEPEMIIPVRSLDQYRSQISLPKPHRVSDFIRKSPKLFELYKDHRRVLWCGMTKKAEDLVEEEDRILEEHQDKAAEYVTRFLMMSVDKRLALDKIVHFRRDFALPVDFRTGWVHKYPQHFKLVKDEEGLEYLELVNWNPAWAITELEKKTMGITEANARGLKAGSKEFDKRAVAIMHELLSFTVEKRLVTDHLTHFRRELVMPQKLMRLLLKHFGIFYVSERGKRFSVFLKEAYEGSELIEKSPLVLWKEKVQSLIGYRGKKIETFSDMSDMEDNGFDERQSENEDIDLQIEQEETEGDMEDDSLGDNSEMDIDEVCSAYEDNTKRC